VDFDFPEELRLLQATVRRFVREELFPVEPGVLRERSWPPALLLDLQAKARAANLWLAEVPAEHGGIGLSPLGLILLWDEAYQSVAMPFRGPTCFGPEVPPLLYSASEAQNERYLQPLLEGKRRGCLALSEPQSGAELGTLLTEARRVDGGYLLSGEKSWVHGAAEADFVIVIAKAPEGPTAFLVDLPASGCRLSKPIPTMLGEPLYSFHLEECRVPVDALLGRLGEALVERERALPVEQMKQAAREVGVAERALQMSREYAGQRVTFGKPLARRQQIQWMLVDSALELHLTRLLLYETAWRAEQGENIRSLARMLKLQANEMASRVLDRALQIHGGIGLTTDFPLERWFRHVRAERLEAGTTERLRSALAHELLNLNPIDLPS
jgi:acyl-CoA dehydrogenase